MRKSCVLGQRRVQEELLRAVSGVLAAAVLFFMVFHTRSQMVSKSFSTLSARALAATKGMLCALAHAWAVSSSTAVAAGSSLLLPTRRYAMWLSPL